MLHFPFSFFFAVVSIVFWCVCVFFFVIVGYLSNRFTIGNPFELVRSRIFKNVWFSKGCYLERTSWISRVFRSTVSVQQNGISLYHQRKKREREIKTEDMREKWTKLAEAHWINRLKYGWRPYQLRKLLAVSSIFWNTSKQWADAHLSFTVYSIWEKYLICIRFASYKINNGIHFYEREHAKDMVMVLLFYSILCSALLTLYSTIKRPKQSEWIVQLCLGAILDD